MTSFGIESLALMTKSPLNLENSKWIGTKFGKKCILHQKNKNKCKKKQEEPRGKSLVKFGIEFYSQKRKQSRWRKKEDSR